MDGKEYVRRTSWMYMQCQIQHRIFAYTDYDRRHHKRNASHLRAKYQVDYVNPASGPREAPQVFVFQRAFKPAGTSSQLMTLEAIGRWIEPKMPTWFLDSNLYIGHNSSCRCRLRNVHTTRGLVRARRTPCTIRCSCEEESMRPITTKNLYAKCTRESNYKTEFKLHICDMLVEVDVLRNSGVRISNGWSFSRVGLLVPGF